MNKLKHYSKEQYNFHSPGREGPLIIENHQSPVLETLSSHKYVTSRIMVNRKLLPIGQGGVAGEAGAGLCGSSVLRKGPCPWSQASILELSLQYPGRWIGSWSSSHQSTPRYGKVQLASLWKPLPPNSYKYNHSTGISIRWMSHPWGEGEERAAAMHTTLPTGRRRMPVAIFHNLIVLLIQPVPNGKYQFDHNWI